jgi:glutamate synthase (NADPH/NADH) large chain
VEWQRVETEFWEAKLRALVEEHLRLTASKFAEALLRDWDRELPKFWQIVPKDLIAIGALEAPTRKRARASA